MLEPINLTQLIVPESSPNDRFEVQVWTTFKMSSSASTSFVEQLLLKSFSLLCFDCNNYAGFMEYVLTRLLGIIAPILAPFLAVNSHSKTPGID